MGNSGPVTTAPESGIVLWGPCGDMQVVVTADRSQSTLCINPIG